LLNIGIVLSLAEFYSSSGLVSVSATHVDMDAPGRVVDVWLYLLQVINSKGEDGKSRSVPH
jgi:hypothetical protein